MVKKWYKKYLHYELAQMAIVCEVATTGHLRILVGYWPENPSCFKGPPRVTHFFRALLLKLQNQALKPE